MPRTRRPPSYLAHKGPDGKIRARVVINGRTLYLGDHGSPESHQRYEQVIARWRAGIDPVATIGGCTVAELVARFMVHAKERYRKEGVVTTEVASFRQALRPLRELYAAEPVACFSAPQLKAVRRRMIDYGWNRANINAQVRRILRVFTWAESEELAPEGKRQHLATVASLREGEAAVAEPVKRLPVLKDHVTAILSHAQPAVATMVQLQQLTGMRPGEVVVMRPEDIDMEGTVVDGVRVWLYLPHRHKMQHRHTVRLIGLGPQCQSLLATWLATAEPDQYLFRPPYARTCRRYQVQHYRHRIWSACDRAGVPRFPPARLRHSTASRLAPLIGEKAVAKMLGHGSDEVTVRHYIEQNLPDVVRLAAQFA
jgi:integrase